MYELSPKLYAIITVSVLATGCGTQSSSSGDTPPSPECQSNERRCDGNVSQQCVNGQWENDVNCADTGVTCDNGNCSLLVPSSDPDGPWSLLPMYSDEFNSSGLDLTRWDNDKFSLGYYSNWDTDPSHAFVENGSLIMVAEYMGPEHECMKANLTTKWPCPYSTAIVQARAGPLLYGYLEVRLKGANRYPGVVPAFWGMNQQENENGEIAMWTELDFVELTQDQTEERKRRLWCSAHVFAHPDLPELDPDQRENHYREQDVCVEQMAVDPTEEFQTYGFQWNKDMYRWYINGELIRERPNTYFHQALYIRFSMAIRPPLRDTPDEQGFPTSYEVDYIRVWKTVE